MLLRVDKLACAPRPFPDAQSFVMTVAGTPPPLTPSKPRRDCERPWMQRGVNVRSTLWAGARGGAAMTAACLKLLVGAGRPLWPWASGRTNGCIAEAFPAAQLRHWGSPYQRYNGARGAVTRRDIVGQLEERVRFGHHLSAVLNSADALDAVVCAFAAVAVSSGKLAEQPAGQCKAEGWIAVHT